MDRFGDVLKKGRNVMNKAMDAAASAARDAHAAGVDLANQIGTNASHRLPPGNIIEINGKYLSFVKLLDEGGFAFVWLVYDVATGQQYALKRMFLQTREYYDNAMREVNFMKQLNPHDNIIGLEGVRLGDAGSTKEVNILMDLAKDFLIEVMRRKLSAYSHFSEEQVLKIFLEICKGVAHMHAYQPPVLHRDLKIENVLIGYDNKFKLCDFGSATTRIYTLDTKEDRLAAEEDVQKNTTLAYQSPEMADLYSGFAIGPKSDVWALGCILYKLCYFKGPFEEASALQIINAKYRIPTEPSYSKNMIDLIKYMLTVDVNKRPDVWAVMDRVCALLGLQNDIRRPSPSAYPQPQPRAAPVQAPVSPTPAAAAVGGGGGGLFDAIDWYDNTGNIAASSKPAAAPAISVTQQSPYPQYQHQYQGFGFDDNWADFSDFGQALPAATSPAPYTSSAQTAYSSIAAYRQYRAAQHIRQPSGGYPASTAKASPRSPLPNRSSPRNNNSNPLFDQLEWQSNDTSKPSNSKHIRYPSGGSGSATAQYSSTFADWGNDEEYDDLRPYGQEDDADNEGDIHNTRGAPKKVKDIIKAKLGGSGHKRSLSSQDASSQGVHSPYSPGTSGSGSVGASAPASPKPLPSKPSLSIKDIFDVNNLKDLSSSLVFRKQRENIWVIKATSSAKTEPKGKYVRRLTIEMWKNKDISRIMVYFRTRPIFYDPVVCFKTLTTMHHLIQDGPVEVYEQLRSKQSLLLDIQDVWNPSTNGFSGLGSYGSGSSGSYHGGAARDPHFCKLIYEYANYIGKRLAYTEQYLQFESNFSLDNLSSSDSSAKVGAEGSPFSLASIAEMLELHRACSKLQMLVFQDKSNLCKVGCMVPLVYDSQDMFRAETHILSTMAQQQPAPALSKAIDDYNYTYKLFYQYTLAIRSFRVVASMVTLMELKALPPSIPSAEIKGPTSQLSQATRGSSRIPVSRPSTSSSSSSSPTNKAVTPGDDYDSDFDEDEKSDVIESPYNHVSIDTSVEVTLEECLKMPGNQCCAECNTPLNTTSKWASINLGIFICNQCSGFHRGLGVHISKVRSVNLDKWSQEQIQFMKSVGNTIANQYWEHNMPEKEKPRGIEDLQKLGAFIRKKYADRAWVTRSSRSAGSGTTPAQYPQPQPQQRPALPQPPYQQQQQQTSPLNGKQPSLHDLFSAPSVPQQHRPTVPVVAAPVYPPAQQYFGGVPPRYPPAAGPVPYGAPPRVAVPPAGFVPIVRPPLPAYPPMMHPGYPAPQPPMPQYRTPPGNPNASLDSFF